MTEMTGIVSERKPKEGFDRKVGLLNFWAGSSYHLLRIRIQIIIMNMVNPIYNSDMILSNIIGSPAY